MKTNNGLVSIIIPTFKRADYIDRAILSVMNQSYSNWELIIVDDNNENTLERFEMENKMLKYVNNQKIKYIKHEKNKNGAAARNTGILNSNGDYITFLDDDDFYLKDRLKIIVDFLSKNKEYDGVYTSGCVLYKDFFYAKLSGNLQKEILSLKPIIRTGSNMFFRRKVFDEVGLFDETFTRHQDLEILVRFFRKFKICAIDKVLVVKDDSIERINWPNAIKTLEVREKFIDNFKEDINKCCNKNKILFDNYLDLYCKVCISKNNNKNVLCEVKNNILKYGNLSFKIKIKMIIYKYFKFLINLKNWFKYKILYFRIKSAKTGTLKEIKDCLK